MLFPSRRKRWNLLSFRNSEPYGCTQFSFNQQLNPGWNILISHNWQYHGTGFKIANFIFFSFYCSQFVSLKILSNPRIAERYGEYVYEWPTNALTFSSLLFYSTTPTCFDTYVSSSGSSFVPAELHANRIQWLIRLRFTICLVTLPSAYALDNITRQIGAHQAST
jgi:hypothetical protein